MNTLHRLGFDAAALKAGVTIDCNSCGTATAVDAFRNMDSRMHAIAHAPEGRNASLASANQRLAIAYRTSVAFTLFRTVDVAQ